MPLSDTRLLIEIICIALAGGVIGLDRTALGQFMISQPIVAGPLVGWMLGDISAGLVIGALLELIWVLDIPVGTFVPADATIVAISATAISILGSAGGARSELVGFSLLLTTGMVQPTMMVDQFIRKRNARFAESASSAAGDDIDQAISRAHLSGLAVFFLKSFVLCLFFIPVGLIAVMVFEKMPAFTHRAMALFIKLLPYLGAALVVRKLSIRKLEWFFLAGFIVAASLTLVFHVRALIIVVLVAAMGFLKVRYSE